MNLKKTYFLLAIQLTSIFAFSQIGGEFAYSFLKTPIPARTAALGGSTIGIKDGDVSLIQQNPAALNNEMSNNGMLSYINYITDINFLHAVYAKSFDSIGHFAVAIQNVNYGRFKETDEDGVEKGTFNANDYLLTLSFAKDIDSSFTWGINLKTIYSKYYTFYSIGNVVDAGITYRNKKKNFVLSFVLNDFGYQWKNYSVNNKDKLPGFFNLGLSKKLAKAPIRFIFNYENLTRWDLSFTNSFNSSIDPLTKKIIEPNKFNSLTNNFFRHLLVGAEISPSKHFHLRIGYNYRRRKEMQLPDASGMVGFSLGFGLKVSKFNVNYAFTKYHAAGNSSHISISTNFSSF